METRLIILLSLAVAISGCADNSGDVEVGASSGNGLEIESLGVADETLNPGQRTTLSLTLKNYHTQQIEIEDISVFNDGQLIIGDGSTGDENKEAECSSSRLPTAKEGIAPEIQCIWNVKAPEEDNLGAFESKPMPISVRIAYDSKIINSEPLKVQFKPSEDIENVEPVEKSFDNGEVEASMKVENPVSTQSGGKIDFKVQNAGPGFIEGDYGFDYTPDSVFEDCAEKHSEEEPVIGSTVEFSCQVQNQAEAARNLFTSISYKYVKTPTVDIEVVKR